MVVGVCGGSCTAGPAVVDTWVCSPCVAGSAVMVPALVSRSLTARTPPFFYSGPALNGGSSIGSRGSSDSSSSGLGGLAAAAA